MILVSGMVDFTLVKRISARNWLSQRPKLFAHGKEAQRTQFRSNKEGSQAL
jgi:hypothetical protein